MYRTILAVMFNIFRNKKFWMICITYGVSHGVYGTWQSVLDVNLKPHNISEVCNIKQSI